MSRRLAAEWADEVVGYLLHGRHAYRIRRVRTADLSRVGLSHIEGSDAYREIRAELAAERERQMLSINRSPEDAERVNEDAARAKLTRTIRGLEKIESTPQGREALQQRADAYICAAVDGAAELVAFETESKIVRDPPAVVTHDPATGNAYDNGGWDPWRWTTSDDEDLDAGVVSLSRRTPAVRHLWSQLIQVLLHTETRSRVGTFPSGSPAAPAAARPGADVPHGPVDGGSLEPGAHRDGDRDAVGGGG